MKHADALRHAKRNGRWVVVQDGYNGATRKMGVVIDGCRQVWLVDATCCCRAGVLAQSLPEAMVCLDQLSNVLQTGTDTVRE